MWYQQDITAAGWPLMMASTYYWVVVTPSQPLTFASGLSYNGATWVGIDDNLNPTPPQGADLNLYRGRQLISQRWPGDSAFYANTQNAVNLLSGALQWGDWAPPQYTNWYALNSTVRYGIQVIGWQQQPPISFSG